MDRSEAQNWVGVGPYGSGGMVAAVATDPGSETVYVAGYQGVSKSVDGGAHWKGASAGLTVPFVRALAVDRRTPSVLYAGTSGGGVFKSVDAGTSWVHLSSSVWDVRALVIDPVVSSTVYAGTFGNGVWKTVDSGATWFSVNRGLTVTLVVALALDPHAPRTLYVAGQADYGATGLAKTTDGGATWTTLRTGPAIGYPLSVAVDASGTVYLAQENVAALVKSTNGGVSWDSISQALPPSANPRLLVLDRDVPGVVYAGSGGTEGNLFKSSDGGLTWGTLPRPDFPPGGTYFSVTALVVDKPNVVWVGTDTNGLHKSSDGGGSWARQNRLLAQLNVTAVATDASTPSTIYAGVSPDIDGARLFRSTDDGETWIPLDTGALDGAPIEEIRIDPSRPSRVFVATNGSGILRTLDAGVTWSKASAGVPDLDAAFSVAIDRQTVYASSDSGVFKSVDDGPWSKTGDVPALGGKLAVAPTAPPTLYTGNRGLGLYRSRDGGATWSEMRSGLEGVLTSIRVDPSSPTTVYVTSRAPYCPIVPTCQSRNGIAKTSDGGETWRLLTGGFGDGQLLSINDLAIDPQMPDHLFAAMADGVYGPGTVGGVFISRDAGESWRPENEGLTGETISTLAVAGGSRSVFAGSSASVFKTIAGVGGGPCTPDRTTLCLNSGRFEVTSIWTYALSGPGQVFPLTRDTGSFWFFTQNNLELVVKVVDGRASNGHFWVFIGALTDVGYTVRVTDMQTGRTNVYRGRQGVLASVADLLTF
ncbi:MAG: hypothetical protein ABI592_11095 [Acidobacteriota bacterium]